MPLHEWKGFVSKDALSENLITWIFEEDSFSPIAKVKGNKYYSILADHLGTPIEMYQDDGSLFWERQLNANGKTIKETQQGSCPFLFQGQYYDAEIELAYNRFRYYDVEDGRYISQDPIGLAGGLLFYGYVHDTNGWVDIFGLTKYLVYQAPELDANGVPTGKIYTGRTRGADNKSNDSILTKRKSSHKRNLGDMTTVHETDNYKTNRGAEHHHINEQRKKGNASDQIDGIAARNFGKKGKKKKGDLYMDAFEKDRKKKNSYSK